MDNRIIYSIEEIKEIVVPIFREFAIRNAGIFGSYARQEATKSSDIDFIIDEVGSKIESLLYLSKLVLTLEEALNKKVDIVTLSAVNSKRNRKKNPSFSKELKKDLKLIYEQELLVK